MADRFVGIHDLHTASFRLQAGCWPVAGRLLAGCWPVAGRLLASCWPVAGWLLAGCWLVAGWLLAGCWQLAGCCKETDSAILWLIKIFGMSQ